MDMQWRLSAFVTEPRGVYRPQVATRHILQ